MNTAEKGVDERGDKSAVRDKNLWLDKNVRRILLDERYAGVQVSGKTKKTGVGSLRSVPVPESEWIRVENAHEAIVPREVFELAQAVVRRFHKTGSDKRRSLFAGKLRCGHCGHALDLYNGSDPYYVCYDGRVAGDGKCFNGRIYVGDLKDIVLSSIRVEAEKALDARRRLLREAKRETLSGKNAVNELKKLAFQCERLRQRIFTLYEDYADGKISSDEYRSSKTDCSNELVGAESRIEELNRLLDSGSGKQRSINDIPLLTRISGASDVTEEMVGMIDRIVVFDAEHIEICFTFGDVI